VPRETGSRERPAHMSSNKEVAPIKGRKKELDNAGWEFQIRYLNYQLRAPWMVEVQKLHDCMDAGGRVTQEQLPRSKFLPTQSGHYK